GVAFAKLNDVESLVAAARVDTGAIVLEPIQGEGGIHPADPEFLEAARQLADELGAVLRSEEHTSELQSDQISYAVFCLKKKKRKKKTSTTKDKQRDKEDNDIKENP